jgi:hypothetical protein
MHQASSAAEASDLHVQQQWDMLSTQLINGVQPCTTLLQLLQLDVRIYSKSSATSV